MEQNTFYPQTSAFTTQSSRPMQTQQTNHYISVGMMQSQQRSERVMQPQGIQAISTAPFTPFSTETPSSQSAVVRHVPPPPGGGTSGDQFNEPLGDGLGLLLLFTGIYLILRYRKSLSQYAQKRMKSNE